VRIARTTFGADGARLPLVTISAPGNAASAVVIHGFGGNKEEQLGLSFRIAELGFDTYTMDLRGHGENASALDPAMFDDVEALIAHCRRAGEVAAVGHSLGGRLALLSSADYRVGISPALGKTFSGRTRDTVKRQRNHRVSEATEDAGFDIIDALPDVSALTARDLVLYGSRDVPEIVRSCEALQHDGQHVVRVDDAFHGDIFVLDATFQEIGRLLAGAGRVGGRRDAARAAAAKGRDLLPPPRPA
jgi:pimeloyl-ACP methyl ester carboxylesterase